MTSQELQQAIRLPAEQAGVVMEKGLVSTIIGDVIDQPGTLPMLQYALTELFDHREGRLLSCHAYQSIGGVLGALGYRAEEVYGELQSEAQDSTRQLFLRLVALGEGGECTRRRVLIAEIQALHAASLSQIFEAFGQARLLTFDRDPTSREPTIEVAHEALLREWPRLRNWLDESRADVRMQRILAGVAVEWLAADRDASFLLRGSRLAQFEGWVETSVVALTTMERTFLESSLEARQERETEEKDRRKRELEQVSIGLAAQAIQELDGPSPERSVLLALEALENYPYTWQAEKALGQAVLNDRLRMALSHDDEVNTASWSQDGTQILTSSDDGTVRLWDVNSGEELWRISEYGPNLAYWSPDYKSILVINQKETIIKMWDIDSHSEHYSIDIEDLKGKLSIKTYWNPWSPSGDYLLLYSTQGKVFVLDTFTGHLIHTLSNHQGEVSKATWSPNGERIATSGFEDSKIIIWDAESGKELYAFQAGFEDERAMFANWSPSGDRFATRGKGAAKIYDTDTGKHLITLQIPQVYIQWVSWSSDSAVIITTGKEDGISRVWDAGSGRELSVMEGLVQAYGVGWSPSGEYAAVAGADGNVHVWNRTTSRQIDNINISRSYIVFVEFSPDGKHILAFGGDNVARILDLSTAEITFHNVSHGYVTNVAWSPDGRQFAFGILVPPDFPLKVWDSTTGAELLVLSSNEELRGFIFWSPEGDRILTTNHDPLICDAATGKQLLSFIGHKDEIWDADWSPDGKQIASASEDGEIIIWDSYTGEVCLKYSGHQEGVLSVAWSPDGSRILSASRAGEATIWDAADGKVFIEFLPEDYQNFVPDGKWSHDGKRVILLTGEGDVSTFDACTGEKLSQFSTSQVSYITLFSLSPSEERILIGGHDGEAKVWNISTGAELLSYDVGGFVLASYSPDGKRVLIGTTEGNYGTLQVFPTWGSTQELIEYAKKHKVFRQLTQEERELFGLPIREGIPKS